jgi:plasmid stabilization system protein ParE
MAYEVVFSPEQRDNFGSSRNIWRNAFLRQNAERYIRRLTEACVSLGDAPYQGTTRDDLAPGIRMTGFERRLSIYFKVVNGRASILGVFYGGQTFDLSG